MRSRTATIEVSKEVFPNPSSHSSIRSYTTLWTVEIGDPKKSVSIIKEVGQDLGLTLIKAVLNWQKMEGLGD